MYVKFEIPCGGEKISLFIYNIPNWLMWAIVIITGLLLCLQKGLLNLIN